MGRRRGYYDDYDDYDGWGYYEPSSPIRVEGGIKTKKGYGQIGETWWSKRWIAVLESFNMGTRLTRGRSYARQGQVLSIDVEPGIVKAKVQGSRPQPYKVEIRLKTLSDKDWDEVTEAMASQAIFAAKLLGGEMPNNIEEAFGAVHLSLFPTALRELETSCSCPDYANPCKHIAAVYYLLAERFDEDPFLIFKLRGRTKEQIIEILREKRAATLPPESVASSTSESFAEAEEIVLLEERLDNFWEAGEALDGFTVKPGAPEIDKAILKRLGNAPFAVGNSNITSLLSQAYSVVEAVALEKVGEEDIG
jgi:uncharacterized Zn finger protein